MPGIACGKPAAEAIDRLDRLPAGAQALLRDADDLFSGRTWWELVLAHAMPAGSAAAFVTCRSGSDVLLLAPMLRSPGQPSVVSLTTPYTCRYAPLIADALAPPAALQAMQALAGFCRPAGVTRLDALPADWTGLPLLEQGARQAGLRTLRFEHFGNWHEDVSGLDWSGYLAKRPGALRETVRRRLRKAEALAGAQFHLLSAPHEMDTATKAFEAVYARSWKQPEPFPRFNTALMRVMAAAGALRFAMWSIDGTPAAAQIWVVHKGCATVLKLAHDEAFKAHSPGTVLTALMLRRLLDQERVGEIDFGRGDDSYKQNWAAERRQRIGVLLADPLHPRGALAIAQHAAGRLRGRFRRRAAGGA